VRPVTDFHPALADPDAKLSRVILGTRSMAAPVSEDAVPDLHHRLLAGLADSGRIPFVVAGVRPLSEGNKKITVADAPTRSIVLAASGEPAAVLFVSSPVDAQYVERNVALAAEAKRTLGDDLGSVILEPLAHGRFDELSFALWPWHRPVTAIRGLAYLQRQLLLPRMLRWLREATLRTLSNPSNEELRAHFVQPLERMALDQRFAAAARDLARAGMKRLEAGLWRPHVVLQHKDFGQWNVLRPARRGSGGFTRGFVLIDWAGARLRGYPFVNLLALGRTSRMPPYVLRRELIAHCRMLSAAPADVMSYLMASLGYLGSNLGYFAEADYLSASRGVIAFSTSAVGGLSPTPA